MADKSELIDKIIDSGIDVKNRRIYFGVTFGEGLGNDFSWVAVEYVIRTIAKLVVDAPKRPIELHMSSPGGEVTEMLRLYDAIQECPCQVKFFGSGVIASSATWIMAGCDERHLAQNTEVLIHKGYPGISEDNTETDTEISISTVQKQTKKLMKMYEDNSRMPAEFWEEISKRDLTLTADEAVALGLADFIVPYKKRGNLRRKRIAALSKKVDKSDMRKLVNDINKRIQRGKNLRIELHVPEEEFDKEVVIDDTPVVIEDQSRSLTTAHSSAQNAVEHILDKEASPDSDPLPRHPIRTGSLTDTQEPNES